MQSDIDVIKELAFLSQSYWEEFYLLKNNPS